MMTKYLEKGYLYVLILILIGGFIFRLYRIDNPVADWQSWRQADTSAVTRNFVEHGFDLLHPRMNNISNVQSGLDNPQGYFFAEFPIYNATSASLYLIFHGFTLEEWERIVTDFSSLIAALFIYLLVKRHSNKKAALFSAAFYAFIPYDIYYGRVILPDPSMNMAILGGIYFFDLWIEERLKIKDKRLKIIPKSLLFYILTIVFTALAFLLKPYSLFYLLPMAVLVYNKWKWKFFLKWQLWLFMIISVLPLVWWRTWMLQYPAGIPANAWLFNGNGIRFHPAFFRWIFYERITKLISGYVGVIFLLVGSWSIWKDKKERLFFISFIVSSLAYLCTIATGNVQHDYYQIPIMPTVAMCMGLGAVWLVSLIQKRASIKLAYGIVIVGMLLSFYIGWQEIQPYFDIDNPSIIAAGKAVQELTAKNALIIANYNGDSAFLYQTDRQGWASYEHDLPTLHKMGAHYLVLANPTASDMVFAKDYKVLVHTSQYVIFDLNESSLK